MKNIESLLCRLLWGQLQSIGLFTEKNSLITNLKTKIGIVDLYDRWLEETIAVLVRNNYLNKDGDSCTVIADTLLVDTTVLWKEWDEKKDALLIDYNIKAQVVLVEAMLRALPEIITGKVVATDIMFPDSSLKLVEGIYKNNIVADYFNEVLAETVVAYIEERLKQDPLAQIRILEVGAGTGGTSAVVLEKVKHYQDHIQEYCYTDISKAFLLYAEKAYSLQYPCLIFKTLNVENPVTGEDISVGAYDLVIAANILHATKNIRKTLRNIKAILKSNGLILLNEINSNTLINHLTFGLLEGWWLYEDQALRIQGCPGLYPKTWRTVLESEGFRSVFFPAQDAYQLGQQIIVAESDGFVRQKKEHKTRLTAGNTNVKLPALNTKTIKQKPAMTQDGIPQDLLQAKSTAYIKQLIGEALNIPVSKIDSAEPMEKYGIDSILVVHLTNTLRKVFDDISTTLFFECQTIDALVERLIKTQRKSLIMLLGLTQHELEEQKSNDSESTTLPSSEYFEPRFRKNSRFLKACDSKIAESVCQHSKVQDVAIIGLAGRYPRAKNVNEFWNNLKEGINCITEIPKDRWDWQEYFVEEKGKKGAIYTKWGGFIEDIDKFDPLFFHISPLEAEQMDPQERLFLEMTYASIEDAGYTPATLCENRKIGVFVGVMNGNYPTGSAYWSIANRVSYLMNFQGPSMAVDTACSSSLTAIHLALESMYSGISECAIVGGVNLIVDPVHYMRLSAATMLSADDKCKSFGDQADGFVDGEGVGAIVLKTLIKAIEDGDHIYGIIKGSMINAGGKTNGYTVPNPKAQSQLISEALQQARVQARAISYLEAHGTGTVLGDPIEIAGLTQAFAQDTKDKQFCAIGSVKSNIGHCESAAGIAGITKVLLQLKHRQLVPSLHAKALNPNIDFSDTPFIIQQDLAEWKRPISGNEENREYPRIASVSSFGAGGSNAHLVIEEYIAGEYQSSSITITPQNPAIIVLSAKNEDRLYEQAKQLLSAVKEQNFSDANLADIAYTLQVGREVMEERLGFIAGSINELTDNLRDFVESRDGTGELYRGQVKHKKDALVALAADEDMMVTVDVWITKKKYAKLIDLWVKGLVFDWNKLYGDVKPRRISLPTYPFGRESYWIPANDVKYGSNTIATLEKAPDLHPLLHQNTSDLSGLRFSSTFTGQEVFFADYVIKGQRILPREACLEMAQVAVMLAAGSIHAGKTVQTKDVVWGMPAIVGEQPLPVHTRLFPEVNGEIAFEIYSIPETIDAEPVIHSQGSALINEVTFGTLMLHPYWKEQVALQQSIACDYIKHVVILCETDVIYQESIENQINGVQCLVLASQQHCIGERFTNYAIQIFKEIQIILAAKPINTVLVQVVISTQNEQQLFSGLAGLLKTASLENPKLIGQLIEVDAVESTSEIIEKLKENSYSLSDDHIRYQEGKRWVVDWRQVENYSEAANIPWKRKGVYLITGGIGGLGLIFAKEIAHRNKNVTLILTGRSPINNDNQTRLKELAATGACIEYRQADVSNKESVESLIQGIQDEFETIDGIIHSAGLIRDSFILKKTEEEMKEVLAPKVTGLLNIDQATKDIKLDFFVFFSSRAGVVGNPGQADYSAANAFMDAYASYRNTLVISKKRHGQTLSVNWPLWQEGRMQIDGETQRIIQKNEGIIAMRTETGIKALYQGMASGLDRVMVLEGDLSKIHKLRAKKTIPIISLHQTDSGGLGLLRKKTLHQLKMLFGDTIKLTIDRLDPEEVLENYGIDSIVITQLNHKLAENFGEVSKTIFYEYRTLGEVADFLTKQYPQECKRWGGFLDKRQSMTEETSTELCVGGKIPILTSFINRKMLLNNSTIPDNRTVESVAIIGLSGRFPQAKTLEEYWQNLKAGKNCITEIPEMRWDWKEYFHSNRQETTLLCKKSYGKWGAFLDEFDKFDPLFFNMTPDEAENTDPQERLFLEECWKALEDAGYPPSSFSLKLQQRTGVFGGITKQGFNLYGAETLKHFPVTSFSSLVNRVSYALNLQGPSIPIDTMCSSALVAIHQACDYIRQGKGDLAIAGGVNLYLHPSTYIGLSINQILSATANSAAFCKNGNGFVPGEGVGAIVLKSYKQAIKDRDSIYAVIRGTAINHSGRTNGYAIPSPNQQAVVIEQALEQSNIDPRTISYIEAAANGSEMGDAIEMTALTKIFKKNRSGVKGNFGIGSVKPNIGHCEAASGMAQIIKVILALNHRTLVPTLITGDLNPNINFNELPFKLQQEVAEWKTVTVDGHEVPRRAGITGVGAGGVNAHIVVEEYISTTSTASDEISKDEPVLFILSAKSKDRLVDYVGRWIMYLKQNHSIDLESIAYTLQIGREEMSCRLAIVTNSKEELLYQLVQWNKNYDSTDSCHYGDLKKTKNISERVGEFVKNKNLYELAKLWTMGNTISWLDLYYEKKLFRVAQLPTYPFERKTCWIKHKQLDHFKEKYKMKPIHQYENKAAEFYNLGAVGKTKEFNEEYLTFCPFEQRIPGFSMTRVFLHPDNYPKETELLKMKQIEMRQVLFCKEDFQRIRTVFDIGCGYGTDVIQIARLYPHIQTHGFTITKAQADIGNHRISQMNLGSQVKIFHRDSSKDSFPGCYDLVIGIEVSFHIRNKHGLFQNIANALDKDGKVLLMDYIANLRGPIVDLNIEISISTKQDWINILSQHNLVIDEIIDVSPQIANFLCDPELEQNIINLPEVMQSTFRNYANQSISLAEGWISYCLFKLKKDTESSERERRGINEYKIMNKISYTEALAEMSYQGHIPYPSLDKTIPAEIGFK